MPVSDNPYKSLRATIPDIPLNTSDTYDGTPNLYPFRIYVGADWEMCLGPYKTTGHQPVRLSQIPWQVWKKWCNLHLWLSWPLLASIAMVMVCHDSQQSNCSLIGIIPWENQWSPWTRGELTVTTVVTAPGANDHGSFTARLGHSSVTARSQLSHGLVTAQSRWGHSSVTARSQLNHGDHGSIKARSQLNHGSVTAGCDHFGHRELTVSSHGGQFFSHGMIYYRPICLFMCLLSSFNVLISPANFMHGTTITSHPIYLPIDSSSQNFNFWHSWTISNHLFRPEYVVVVMQGQGKIPVS